MALWVCQKKADVSNYIKIISEGMPAGVFEKPCDHVGFGAAAMLKYSPQGFYGGNDFMAALAASGSVLRQFSSTFPRASCRNLPF